ncbi:AEC family transporter [Achromobacter sp. F4_2707]|uniref:AEC family transporter n=1 Tax=Achromobacter sp. F4_2707 TaxID=3114286 RepID=UPI0039C731C0
MSSWLAQYLSILALLLPVFVCVGIGAVWGFRKLAYPGEFISLLVTSITTPALVFNTLLTTELNNALLLQILNAALLGLLVACLCGAALLYVLRLPVLALLPSTLFPNAGNLGLPVALFAFGETGLAVAVTIFAIFSLGQHTIGVWLLGLANRSSPRQGKWPYGVALASLLAVALRLLDVSVPSPVLSSAQLVGSLTVPLMLLSLGYALATVSRSGMRTGGIVGVIRLSVGAIAGLAIVYSIDLPPEVASVVVLQMLMPVAVVTYLYTDRYTNYGQVSAGAILVSTLLFLFLSPVLISWSHLLPS